MQQFKNAPRFNASNRRMFVICSSETVSLIHLTYSIHSPVAMNKLRLGILAATIASVSAFAPFAAFAQGSNGACWGSETQEFAHTGTLGDHSSQQDTPRTGLGNLQQSFDDGFAGLVNFLTGETCDYQ